MGTESFGPAMQGRVRRRPVAELAPGDLPQAQVALRVVRDLVLNDGEPVKVFYFNAGLGDGGGYFEENSTLMRIQHAAGAVQETEVQGVYFFCPAHRNCKG